MSKRCCAKHCFNSTLYSKNLSYFSFPKNKKFADLWADLAGRSDLKEKPLNCIIKYFLCSEHFTANCFLDKDNRQKLKRDLPRSIALPSIFKNNLQETMQIVNPKQSIEIHNIIVLEDDNRIQLSSLHKTNDYDDCHQKSTVEYENANKEYLATGCEVLKNVEIIEELVSSSSESREQVADPLDEYIPLARCRLCFKELNADEPTIRLNESLELTQFINRVMSDKITIGDKYSQVVCKNCENNSLLCLLIIQQMHATQDKISSTTEKTYETRS